MDIKFIQDLEKSLSGDLPGEEAQLKMAPMHKEAYRTVPNDHKLACVMILIFPKNKEWHLCLIERPNNNPDDKHAGQLSFPGGQLDEGDDTFEDCALREVYEEIGVAPETIGILGSLTPLYVFVSNFLVHPFVGFTNEYPSYIKQESEVTEIIEVPIKHFTRLKNKGIEDISVRELVLPQTPYYDVNGKRLWGATAMMMSELEHILADIEID